MLVIAEARVSSEHFDDFGYYRMFVKRPAHALSIKFTY